MKLPKLPRSKTERIILENAVQNGIIRQVECQRWNGRDAYAVMRATVYSHVSGRGPKLTMSRIYETNADYRANFADDFRGFLEQTTKAVQRYDDPVFREELALMRRRDDDT